MESQNKTQAKNKRKTKVIIVTGCNKGVGYGIVEGLCMKKEIPTVIMACRNEERAIKARNKLSQMYPMAKEKLIVAVLDISDFNSCNNFANWVRQNFQQVDCLVNNAGIAINCSKNNEVLARKTSKINYFGTAYLSSQIFPLLVFKGKMIFVTGQAGKLTKLSLDLRNRLLHEKTYAKVINQIAEEYFTSYRTEKTKQLGFMDSMLGMSKVFTNCFVKFWAQTKQVKSRKVQMYSLCPGSVSTDMNKKGTKTLSEGAKTPLYLIDLPYEMDKSKQGKFFVDERPIPLI